MSNATPLNPTSDTPDSATSTVVVLGPEKEPQQGTQIVATESEIDAMGSLRVEHALNFRDDEIVMGRMRDLPHRILVSRNTEALDLPPSEIHIFPGLNPRLPSAGWDAYVEELAESMLKSGYWTHKPIYGFVAKEAKGKKVYIADGESRYRAAVIAIERGAKFDTIPVRLAPEGTSVEDIMLQLAPSNVSREFTPLEKAIHARRLVTYGYTVPVIAENFGVSTEYVSQLLVLAAAPQKIRQFVHTGTIPANMAIEVLRGPEPEKAVETLTKAVATAKAQGKDRATPKHLPNHQRQKAIKSNSESLHQCLSDLTKSESFILLDDKLREQIEALIAKVEKESQPKEPKAPKKSKSLAAAGDQETPGDEDAQTDGEASKEENAEAPKLNPETPDSENANASASPENVSNTAASAVPPKKVAGTGVYTKVNPDVVRPRPKKAPGKK